jgi:ABC-2 type transport system ATP-binding protein
MLKFKNITKTFKTELMTQPFVALNDVSFEVPNGSMVGFLGANGAGKTTSLKIIMDFIRADKGSVEFDSKIGNTRNAIFKNIGFLPERPYFYPNLTGDEFLLFMGQLSEMKIAQIKEMKNKWAPRFRIDYALNRPLRTYSKGMLQRIGFLATILHEPQFIVLDEPLSGLDPIGRKELKDVIIEVHKEGKTVFFSSHIVSDIEEICDRVIFLKEGKLVYDGSVEKLLNSGTKTEFIIKFKTTNDPKVSNYKNLHKFPDNLYSIKVDDTSKAQLIKELTSQEIDLVGIEQVKPSLEEIFYNIRPTT